MSVNIGQCYNSNPLNSTDSLSLNNSLTKGLQTNVDEMIEENILCMLLVCFWYFLTILKNTPVLTLVYNAFNVYCRELAPGTVSLTGDRAQGDDSKHCANSNSFHAMKFCMFWSSAVFLSTLLNKVSKCMQQMTLSRWHFQLHCLQAFHYYCKVR